jgi:phage gpG-like protein
MDGIRIEIDAAQLGIATAFLGRLGQASLEPLLSDIGAVLESSTRKRVEETKTSPDGAAWPPNRAGTSTLLESGRHLRDSIAFIASPAEVQVGSSWEFAHVHQDGAVITPRAAKRLVFMLGGQKVFARRVTIPARPFVGFSEEDRQSVELLVTDFFGRLGATQ